MATNHVLPPHASTSSYLASGFANRMGWGLRPALMLIDVCQAYWSAGSPLDLSSNPAAAASPAAMRELLKAARQGGCPVVWIQVEYTHPDMADAGLYYRKAKVLTVWQKGDPRGLDAMVEGLEPLPTDVVIKKKYVSAFFGTSLATELRLLGVDTLVIGGVSTSGCVRGSTLDAMQHGFRPMVRSQGHPRSPLLVLMEHRLLGPLVVIAQQKFMTPICSTSMPNMRM